MKMKKLVALALCAMMVVSMFAACSNKAGDGGGSSKSSKKAIRLVNGKIEIDKQLKAYAKDYEERTGQEVVIESLGGGVDISGQIKNYKAAGNMPDIFVTTFGDIPSFGDMYYDLSHEKWVEDTDMALKDTDGKIIGAPYSVEGVGLVYNADILQAAGIDPDTLTNINAQKAAFETLEAKKAELGLQSVISVAAESGQMYWSTGNHIFSSYLSMGQKIGDQKYLDLLNKGEIDKDRMTQFADYFALLCQYADKTVLESGTYDDQLALFANGKAAFITQGNWLDPSLPEYTVESTGKPVENAGILPYAMLEEDTPGVTADSPSWWAVSKDSKNLDAALAFLDDILLSDAGQKMFVEDCGAVSAYKSCKYTPSTPISANLFERMQSETTYAWDWNYMPLGIAQNATAPVFELYAKGEIDQTKFVDMMGTAIADYIANQAK
ncbi:MAG: ABC transporter substrate-binding protein [Clostridiales Family XIII bacterium]|jgi:raffinose/stachyose/melibiose transport system substrate-binding protein|nr:ABC transporter substrate-binding protein [Clostridiales Family XIII bacterium]